MVVIVGEIDVSVVYGPTELVVLIHVWTVFVVVNLRSSAVLGMSIGRNERETGVVGVEGIVSATAVDIGVIHAKVASPFARESH